MITKKEMGYINSWPNRIPYPGEEYCDMILTKLEKCMELYIDKYLNKKFTIQFSNKEEINFEIQEKNLCHILGIEYKRFKDNYLTSYNESVLDMPYDFSSYMLLNRIIEKRDNVLRFDKSNNACSTINYFRVGIKCDIFSKLADISNFNYGCINFNKSIYNKKYPDISFSATSSKLLYTPSDETVSPYFMMGIKQDTNFGFSMDNSEEVVLDDYIIETLMAVDDPTRFFDGQEVVIPTQIMTDVNNVITKNAASPAEKIKLIREYQNIVNKYKIDNNLNIFEDYLSLLMSNKDDMSLRLTK